MSTQAFVDAFYPHIRENYPDDLIILCNCNTYMQRLYCLGADFSSDTYNAAFEKLGSSFGIGFGSMENVYGRFYNEHDIPAEIKKSLPVKLNMSDREQLRKIVSVMNSTGYSKGVFKADTTHRPWVFIDIDLKDNFELLHRKGLLPEEVVDKQMLSDYLQNTLPGASKRPFLGEIINFNLLLQETDPAMVVFTGNGYHLWYNLPQDLELNGEGYFHLANRMHTRIKEDLFKGLILDGQCMSNGATMRLPGTINSKGKIKTRVEVMHYKNFNEVSIFVKECLKFVNESPSKASKSKVGSGTDNLVEKALSFNRKISSEYFRDLQRDRRLLWFVRENLKGQDIFDLFNITLEQKSGSEEKGWTCCSPFRIDKHPSFVFSDKHRNFKDWATGEEGDYGTLLKRLLDMKKEELGLFKQLPTTRYEVSILAVLIALLRLSSDRKINKPKFPFLLKEYVEEEVKKKDLDEEAKQKAGDGDIKADLPTESGGKRKKKTEGDAGDEDKGGKDKKHKGTGRPKIILGQDYYNEMLSTVYALMDSLGKGADYSKETSTSRITDNSLRNLIIDLPKVYYFYEYHWTMEESAVASVQAITALSIINFMFKHPLAYQTRGKRINLYILNSDGLYLPYSEEFPYVKTGGVESNELHVRIQFMLASMNALSVRYAVGGVSALIKTVASTIQGLMSLEHDINNYLNSTITINKDSLCKVISEVIRRKYQGVYVSPRDLRIMELDTDSWAQFNNCFVKYNSNDVDTIGDTIQYSSRNKEILLTRTLVDIRFPYDYDPKQETPMFDKFLDFLDDGKNMAKKSIGYLMGSILFSPTGISRAVLVEGNSGKNGKSTLGEILQGIFTDKYVSTKQIHTLCEDNEESAKARAGVRGKLLNISMDSKGRAELGHNFKSLITGEHLKIKILYENERNIALRAHHFINVNSLPKVTEDPSAIKRRFVTIRLTREVNSSEVDTQLSKKILEREASGIWGKVIEHAKNYAKNNILGFFSEDELRRNEQRVLDDNPLFCFIEDYVHPMSKEEAKNSTHMTASRFRKAYNAYLAVQNKNKIQADVHIDSAMQMIRDKYKEAVLLGKIDVFNKDMFVNGFKHCSNGKRGIPLKIFVPREDIGHYEDINSMEM